MNSIVRSALRASTMRVFNPVGRRDFARTFWHMSKPNGIPAASMTMLKTPSQACNCGSHYVHTNGMLRLLLIPPLLLPHHQQQHNQKK